MNKKLFISLATLVAVGTLACAGEGSGINKDNPPKPKPTKVNPGADSVVPIGEPITITSGGNAITYTLSQPTQKEATKWGDNPKNGTFLLLYLEVESVAGTVYACDCRLSFVAPSGKVYKVVLRSFEGVDQFENVDINTGQKANGWICFDVHKADLNGAKIQLRPNQIQDLYGYWKL